MAGADRTTIEEVVRKVLLDEHADVIREAVKALAAEMMGLEVTELSGSRRDARLQLNLGPALHSRARARRRTSGFAAPDRQPVLQSA
jgi:hypothetical protein